LCATKAAVNGMKGRASGGSALIAELGYGERTVE
jgi:hypothetical protein